MKKSETKEKIVHYLKTDFRYAQSPKPAQQSPFRAGTIFHGRLRTRAAET